MIRRPPRSTQSRSSAASDVYKRQEQPDPQVLTISPELFRSRSTQQCHRWHHIGAGPTTRRPPPLPSANASAPSAKPPDGPKPNSASASAATADASAATKPAASPPAPRPSSCLLYTS